VGYNLAVNQVLNVTWNADGNVNQQNPASSLRFYLLNSSQIGGWKWVRDAYGNQYEQTNSGYLVKFDSFAATFSCVINSTGTYYVILVCEGTYGSVEGPPVIDVYSYLATLSPLIVVISPANTTIDAGQSQMFNSTVSGGIPAYTYQWNLDQVAVPGANGSTWTLTSVAVGAHTVNVNVNDSAGFSVFSNNATIYVSATPTVTISPSPSLVMDVNQSQLFVSTVVNGTPPYSYQWYLNGAPVAGATSSSWTFKPSTQSSQTQIYVLITDGVGVQAASNTTIVTVNSAPIVSLSPGFVSMDMGQSEVFNSTLTSGTSPYSYQWYLSSSPVSQNVLANPGFETGDLSGWNQEGPYNAQVTSAYYHSGRYSCYTPYNSSLSEYVPIRITQKLPNVPTSLVTNVSCWYRYSSAYDFLRVNYTDGSMSSVGFTLSSAWSYVTLNLDPNKTVDSLIIERTVARSIIMLIDDVQFSTLNCYQVSTTPISWTFTPASPGSYTLFLNVEDSVNRIVTSNVVPITVNPQPSVSVSPTPNKLYVNQTQIFNANVTGGTSPFTYQWYLNNAIVPGAGSATLQFISATSDRYSIYSVVTDSAGIQATSNAESIVVVYSGTTAPPFFSVEPKAIPPLSNTNASMNGLETPPLPSPIGQDFTVEIHLRNATLTNIPNGVLSMEVQFDFGSIAGWAVPTGFIQMVGQPFGVLNQPVTFSIAPGFYLSDGVTQVTSPPYTGATQFIVAAASTGELWNTPDGLIANITFQITNQPPGGQPDFYGSLRIVLGEIFDPSSNLINTTINRGTVKIDAQPQVPYTIDTNPSGLAMTVDGVSYTAPQTFNWTVGSNHTIGTDSPQLNYEFANWSDNGAQTHQLTVGLTGANITVYFDLEPYLSILTTPPEVTTIPGQGFYINGTVVNLEAPSLIVVSGNSQYRFNDWDVDGVSQGQTNSISIIMNANHTATANYILQYFVTFGQSGLSSPAEGAILSVNGNAQSYADLPYAAWIDNGSLVTYSFNSTVSASEEGEQFTLVSVIGPASPLILTGSITVTADYATQYLVTFSQTGLNANATGTIIIVNGTAETYQNLPYTLWLNLGDYVTYSYTNTVNSSTSNEQFILTTVDGEPSPIMVTAPTSVNGNYKSQYYLVVTSSYGTQYPPSGWFDADTNISESVSPTVAGPSGIQYVCTGWIGTGSASASGTTSSTSFIMTAPASITWNWKTQYYLTVSSAYDSPTPVGGWFDSGTVINASVTSTTDGSSGTQFVCTGWTGLGSVSASGNTTSTSFTLNAPSSITWNWKTQYYLTVTSTYGVPSPVSGWFDSGTLISASVPSPVSGGLGVQYVCTGWTGTGSTPSSGNNSYISFVIVTSSSVTWNWEVQQVIHDVAVTNVTTSKAGGVPLPTVGRYMYMNVSVTVANIGTVSESSVNVTAYVSANQSAPTVIGTFVIGINNGTTVTVDFVWNATLPYGDYNFSAAAGPVSGETNTGNNVLSGGTVRITIPGDINGDGKVNLSDLVLLALAYGTNSSNLQTIGTGLATHHWNPNADINSDGVVGLSDLVILATHYGKSVTPYGA
jgi:hypothetical protein